MEGNPINFIDPWGKDRCRDEYTSCMQKAYSWFNEKNTKILQDEIICKAGAVVGCWGICSLSGNPLFITACMAACVPSFHIACANAKYDALSDAQSQLTSRLRACRSAYTRCNNACP